MNPKKEAFYEQYAPIAIQQQQLYGIPASITLAQMYLESGGGTSSLAVNSNNYFGVKCSKEWLAAGKPYSLHSDDRKDEKFCSYDSVEASITHHSQILMSDRYKVCHRYDSTDYEGWARGIKAAGYATNPNYVNALLTEVRDYNLHKYDEQAVREASQKGIAIGYGRGQSVPVSSVAAAPSEAQLLAGHYSFPLAGSTLVMTDGYGMAPTGYRNHVHKGIDLSAHFQDVFATEDNGIVVATGSNKSSGKYVTVEYARHDGAAKYSVTYCHLDDVAVSQGDTVHAGTRLGQSGNTGNSTGPHLHLSVKYQGPGDGAAQHIDPLQYLAEISVRGNLTGTVVKKGGDDDLLLSLKTNADTTPTPTEKLMAQRLTPEQDNNLQQAAASEASKKDLLSMLLAQNEQQDGDLISSLVNKLLMGAVSMAAILDNPDNPLSGTKGESTTATEESEKKEKKNPTYIDRQREGVDPAKARELAQINYDANMPEQQQSQGQRLA